MYVRTLASHTHECGTWLNNLSIHMNFHTVVAWSYCNAQSMEAKMWQLVSTPTSSGYKEATEVCFFLLSERPRCFLFLTSSLSKMDVTETMTQMNQKDLNLAALSRPHYPLMPPPLSKWPSTYEHDLDCSRRRSTVPNVGQMSLFETHTHTHTEPTDGTSRTTKVVSTNVSELYSQCLDDWAHSISAEIHISTCNDHDVCSALTPSSKDLSIYRLARHDQR